MSGCWTKRRLAAVCLIFLSLFTAMALPVQASAVTVENYGLSLELPADYTVLNSRNADENLALLETLGYNADSFAAYLQKNSIELFALSTSGTQLTLKSWETDFSNQAVDFSELTDEAMESVAKRLIQNQSAGYELIRASQLDMLCIEQEKKDSGGSYYSVQYVLLRNKRFFAVTFTFPGAKNAENLNLSRQVAESINLRNRYAKGFWNFTTVAETVLIWVVIAAAAVAVVFLTVSLLRDRKKRRLTNETESVYIKRRPK